MSDMNSISEGVRKVVESWRPQRGERLQRTALDPADFDQLAEAGFTRTVVPVAMNGAWESVEVSVRPIAEMLRNIATVDPSVALVAAMHPSVLLSWSGFDTAALPEADRAWQEQRAAVFGHALAGRWWGTVTSEPGSGGDIAATRATARPDPDGRPGCYLLTGDKHFGSGSGVTSFMITTARRSDTDEVESFFIDQRDRPWDASAGCEMTKAWDGVGMSATQSHAFRFVDCPATAFVDSGHRPEVRAVATSAAMIYFIAVVLGVVDAALQEAETRLGPKQDELRPFEAVEWTRAVSEGWLMAAAYEAALRSVERGEAAMQSTLIAKLTGAELADACLERLCRVVGGGTFSRSSPFGRWRQDVRALGFLRPPWALLTDLLRPR
jgi:alkylation response protein AidB-like acyl-CoA dehydrogenase